MDLETQSDTGHTTSTMGKIDEIVPVRTLSWARALGSYVFATVCGIGLGAIIVTPVFSVVWKVCFSVAVYLTVAVLYLWIVLVPPDAAPTENRTRAMELFSRACAQGNITAATRLFETGEIPNSLLQAEAMRLYGDIESTARSDAHSRMNTWLVGRLCEKAPSRLWQTRDLLWSRVVDRWARGPDTDVAEMDHDKK